MNGLATASQKEHGGFKQNEERDKTCEYHIVFAPKYRRRVIYKELRKDIGEIFRKLCKEMNVEIIEAEACVDQRVQRPVYG